MVDLDVLRDKIDFTNVSPTASFEEISEFCKKANRYNVRTVYVQPSLLKYAREILNEHINVGTTGGFPFGNVPLEIKLNEISYASENKARWIDICLNLSNVRSGRWEEVNKEISELKNCAFQNSIGLKLIIEVPFLTNDKIINVVKIAEKEEIEYIKTASGVRNKVTLEQVDFLKSLLKSCKLKVAGGVSSLEGINQFLNMGADIIGCSKGFDILEGVLNG